MKAEVATRNLKADQKAVWDANGKSIGEAFDAAKTSLSGDAAAAKAKLGAIPRGARQVGGRHRGGPGHHTEEGRQEARGEEVRAHTPSLLQAGCSSPASARAAGRYRLEVGESTSEGAGRDGPPRP